MLDPLIAGSLSTDHVASSKYAPSSSDLRAETVVPIAEPIITHAHETIERNEQMWQLLADKVDEKWSTAWKRPQNPSNRRPLRLKTPTLPLLIPSANVFNADNNKSVNSANFKVFI